MAGPEDDNLDLVAEDTALGGDGLDGFPELSNDVEESEEEDE